MGATACPARCIRSPDEVTHETLKEIVVMGEVVPEDYGPPPSEVLSNNWLNDLLQHMWPRFSTYATEYVLRELAPSVNALLPARFNGSFKVSSFEMGAAKPRFGPIKTRRNIKDKFLVDISVDLDATSKLEMSFLSANLGCKDIKINGVLSVVFASPTSQPPFYGGIELYFVNPPVLDLDFTGVAKVAEMPGLRGIIRSALLSQVADLVVLPARMAWDLIPEDHEDEVDLQFPDPLHVLRVTLLSGERLAAKDVAIPCIRAAKSDPYVIMQLGARVWTSPTVTNSLNPTWSKDNEWDFPVYDERQVLKVAVYDQDYVPGGDDYMGESNPIVAEALIAKGQGVETDLNIIEASKDAGTLKILSRALKLSSARTFAESSAAKLGGPSQLLLAVKLTEASGIPEDVTPPFTLKTTVGKCLKMTSMPSQPLQIIPSLMADDLVMICLRLDAEGMAPLGIANALAISEAQVRHILQSREYPKEAEQVLTNALKKQEFRRPQFGEIMRMLLPASAEILASNIAMELQDKKSKSLGKLEIPLEDILHTDGMQLWGPFRLKGNLMIQGNIKLRCLEYDDGAGMTE